MTTNYAELESFSLGPFIVEPASGHIVHGEEVRQIQPKVMQLLLCLVDNHGQIVSREFLLEQVWPGVFVDGGALRRGIYFLRKSLTLEGASSAIDTLSKRGYRLNLSPDETAEPKAATEVEPPAPVLESAYRGLQVFDRDHTSQFFGRTSLISQTCDAMDRQMADGRGFVLLVGSSGSGKSSLARAGVIPELLSRIAASAPEGAVAPTSLIFQSGHGAEDPLQKLARILLEAFGETGTTDQAVGAFIDEITDDVDEAVNKLVSSQGGNEAAPVCRVVLLFDQFEQLLSAETLNDEHRELVVSAIYSLSRSGVIQVIATMRSEFYPQFMSHESLRFLKGSHGIIDVTEPGAAEIADIVRKPAELAGLEFERRADGLSLDAVLIDEASTHANSLPLLQFALRELELGCADSKLLTFAQYAKLGNLEGCLSRHAERVFQNLTAEVQLVLPQVLSLIVTADPRNAGRLLKKTAGLDSISRIPHAQEMIEKFVDARLMVSFFDSYSGAPGIEVVHESVLAYWERAREWAHNNYADIRFRTWLSELSNKWNADSHSQTYLLRDGKLLVDAEKLLGREGFFNENEQQFVRASLRRAARSGKIKRGVVFALVSMLGLSLLMWNNAVNNAKQAQKAKSRSEATSEFMESIFADADPGSSGRNMTAGEILDRARDRVKSSVSLEPASSALIMRSLGESNLKMAGYSEAEQLFYDAYGLMDEFKDDEPDIAAKILLELAGIHREKREFVKARDFGQQALKYSTAARGSFLKAQSFNMLGLIEQDENEFVEAASYFERSVNALETLTEKSIKKTRLQSRVENNRGLTYLLSGDLPSSGSAFEKSLDLLADNGLDESADYSLTLGNLGTLRRFENNNVEAVKLYSQAIEMRIKLHSESHPDVMSFRTNLASSYTNLGDYENVINTTSRALAVERDYDIYGETTVPLLIVRQLVAKQMLGRSYSTKEIDEAISVIPTLAKSYGPQHLVVVEAEMAVALAQWKLQATTNLVDETLCANMRSILDLNEELQTKGPRVEAFDKQLRQFIVSCP